jgi:glutaredoxin-like protein DUF836
MKTVSRTSTLTLLGRSDCGLCLDAVRALRELQLEFEVVDIDAHPDLLVLYNDAIPVILEGSRELCRAPITTETLRSALNAVTLN